MIAAVDPGRDKCGLAVLENDNHVLLKEVILRQDLAKRLKVVADNYNLELIALGNATASQKIKEVIIKLGLTVKMIDETNSTLAARNLYWADHPPQGWRKLIPTSLQTPQRAIDDYAAIILAHRALQQLKR